MEIRKHYPGATALKIHEKEARVYQEGLKTYCIRSRDERGRESKLTRATRGWRE